MSKKIGIVYFSKHGENYVNGSIKKLRIGNTETIVNKLKSYIPSEIFKIDPIIAYPEKYEECTRITKLELQNQVLPDIKNSFDSLDDYDEIILAYPNYWGTMPMPVWTFLKSYDLSAKTIYPLCTHEGSGLGHSIQDIKNLCPNTTIKTGLALYGSYVSSADKDIEKWLTNHSLLHI